MSDRCDRTAADQPLWAVAAQIVVLLVSAYVVVVTLSGAAATLVSLSVAGLVGIGGEIARRAADRPSPRPLPVEVGVGVAVGFAAVFVLAWFDLLPEGSAGDLPVYGALLLGISVIPSVLARSSVARAARRSAA
jgi:hypothetical protein